MCWVSGAADTSIVSSGVSVSFFLLIWASRNPQTSDGCLTSSPVTWQPHFWLRQSSGWEWKRVKNKQAVALNVKYSEGLFTCLHCLFEGRIASVLCICYILNIWFITVSSAKMFGWHLVIAQWIVNEWMKTMNQNGYNWMITILGGICLMAYGILVSWPGIEPCPLCWKAEPSSLDHQEVPRPPCLFKYITHSLHPHCWINISNINKNHISWNMI